MDCLNSDTVSQIVKNILVNSNIKKPIVDQVMQQINETTWVDGKVNLVQTNVNDRTIIVGSGSSMTLFAFPPNSKDAETELIRAQETDRTVTVIYTINNKNIKIITSVLLYGREAYS